MSTYTPIATQTLGSAAPSVTFSSLPQNYTDFIVVANYGISVNLYGLRIRFNDDTGSNYSDTALYGDGSSASSTRDTSATSIITSAVGVSNNVLNYNFICNVQNYSNGSTYKTALIRANAVDRETLAVVGSWRNTNPITSITIFVGSGNILSGSTFTIYGVAAGNSSAKATGGNIVTTDGSYWYHTFTSSGIFTPNEALTCDYLVVAGGGGGGSNLNYDQGQGGGGAGGYRTSIGGSALSLSANTVYQALVGAGGLGSTSTILNGTNGIDSTFSTITSTGGGGGASRNAPNTTLNGSNGGSGGGGGGAGASGTSGGTGTAGQGNNGGTGGTHSGGGGGGASAAGSAGSGATGGAGGAGTANSISGTSITYAGGGGGGGGQSSGTGGAGGAGGGGAGGNTSTAGSNAVVNLGGGGGGGGGNSGAYYGGNGGSGIIIVRYAV